MTYKEALEILEERQEEKWDLGLERVRACLARLGDPHRKVPAIHVAGTNGKGSVCALFDSVLRAAGYSVGLYTSPHLIGVTERIQVDGRSISELDFAEVLEDVLRVEREPLTYFELLTAAAFLYFWRQEVQVAVLEVGLGGRWDATNVIEKPLLSVITGVGLDHTDILGSTLGRIAEEKAGILKPDVVCVCGETKKEPLSVIENRAVSVGTRL
ncbi:MAG: bifunctional folylpolyglutamate synthase/dihydrofolate synthase, partial [Elusimicrobia bacterium]|nr:bifunctional folylpolyglutamate synthase/dihydrofolate synthase [Elusimicrobiota bacterium]